MCTSLSLSVYTYIYIYICISGRNRFGSILYGSRLFEIIRFGSVRFENKVSLVRCGSASVFRTCSGSVRSGSVRFRVRFWPVPESNGQVRFGQFGSVVYSFLSWFICSSRPWGFEFLHALTFLNRC